MLRCEFKAHALTMPRDLKEVEALLTLAKSDMIIDRLFWSDQIRRFRQSVIFGLKLPELPCNLQPESKQLSKQGVTVTD